VVALDLRESGTGLSTTAPSAGSSALGSLRCREASARLESLAHACAHLLTNLGRREVAGAIFTGFVSRNRTFCGQRTELLSAVATRIKVMVQVD
jgi:hypothetical protein